MKIFGFMILCFTFIVNTGLSSSSNEIRKSDSKVDDLEAKGTIGKFLSLVPSYGLNPVYRPNTGGYYPSYGGNYYPSSPSFGGGYYPSYNPPFYSSTGTGSGYFPSGTNVLGYGYGFSNPSQSYYPTTSTNSWYNTRSTDYGKVGSGFGGYGGYGGNGGINSYYGYNNPQYGGSRNLGYGYYSDTDRYGLHKTSRLSVNRSYD